MPIFIQKNIYKFLFQNISNQMSSILTCISKFNPTTRDLNQMSGILTCKKKNHICLISGYLIDQ